MPQYVGGERHGWSGDLPFGGPRILCPAQTEQSMYTRHIHVPDEHAGWPCKHELIPIQTVVHAIVVLKGLSERAASH